MKKPKARIAYSWEVTTTLSEARIKPRKPTNYNHVKFAVDIIKGLIKRENDFTIKSDLAKAGMTLNKILMR